MSGGEKKRPNNEDDNDWMEVWDVMRTIKGTSPIETDLLIGEKESDLSQVRL